MVAVVGEHVGLPVEAGAKSQKVGIAGFQSSSATYHSTRRMVEGPRYAESFQPSIEKVKPHRLGARDWAPLQINGAHQPLVAPVLEEKMPVPYEIPSNVFAVS